jgi:hypothetical protein
MHRDKVTRIDGISAYYLSHQVTRLRCLRGVEKNVLRCLCDHYPNVWPSVETLAGESGWCERSVRKALRKLEADGWICPIYSRRGGTGNSGQYLINAEKILDTAQTCESTDATDVTDAIDTSAETHVETALEGAPDAELVGAAWLATGHEIPERGTTYRVKGAPQSTNGALDAEEPISNQEFNRPSNQASEAEKSRTDGLVLGKTHFVADDRSSYEMDVSPVQPPSETQPTRSREQPLSIKNNAKNLPTSDAPLGLDAPLTEENMLAELRTIHTQTWEQVDKASEGCWSRLPRFLVSIGKDKLFNAIRLFSKETQYREDSDSLTVGHFYELGIGPAYAEWFKDRLVPSYEAEQPIIYPVSVFALEFKAYPRVLCNSAPPF